MLKFDLKCRSEKCKVCRIINSYFRQKYSLLHQPKREMAFMFCWGEKETLLTEMGLSHATPSTGIIQHGPREQGDGDSGQHRCRTVYSPDAGKCFLTWRNGSRSIALASRWNISDSPGIIYGLWSISRVNSYFRIRNAGGTLASDVASQACRI
jgi:hypothetical protein